MNVQNSLRKIGSALVVTVVMLVGLSGSPAQGERPDSTVQHLRHKVKQLRHERDHWQSLWFGEQQEMHNLRSVRDLTVTADPDAQNAPQLYRVTWRHGGFQFTSTPLYSQTEVEAYVRLVVYEHGAAPGSVVVESTDAPFIWTSTAP